MARVPAAEPDAPVATRHWGFRAALVLLGVAVLLVQLHLLEIPWPFDPLFGYMDGATVFSGAGEEMSGLPRAELRPQHRYLRLGLVGSVGLLQSLFGYSEFSYHGIGVVSVVAVAVLTATVARRVLPGAVAIAAGALAVLNPIVLTWSSHPQPDLYMTVWLLAAVVLLPGGDVDDRRLGVVRFAGAGLALGVAWTVKETAPLLFGPVAITALWAARARWRDVAATALAGGLVLVAEGLLLLRTTGDALLRYDVLLGRQGIGTDPVTTVDPSSRGLRLLEQQGGYAGAAAAWIRHLRAAGAPVLAFLAAPLGPVLGLVRTRHRLWVVIGVWSVWPWVFHTLVGPVRIARPAAVAVPLSNLWYWHSLVPPTAIGLAGLLYLAASTTTDRRRATAVAVGLVGVLVLAAWPRSSGDDRMVVNGRGEYAELQSWLAAHEDVEVASDLTTVRVLGIYETPAWGGRSRARFARSTNVDDTPLVAFSEWTGDVLRFGGGDIPTVSPPPDLSPRFVSSNGELVLLERSAPAVTWTPVRATAGVDRWPLVLDDGRSRAFDLPPVVGFPRIRLQGVLDDGGLDVTCPGGGPAAYGGSPATMADHREWQFFCPEGGPPGGTVSVSTAGGRLRLTAIDVATP